MGSEGSRPSGPHSNGLIPLLWPRPPPNLERRSPTGSCRLQPREKVRDREDGEPAKCDKHLKCTKEVLGCVPRVNGQQLIDVLN